MQTTCSKNHIYDSDQYATCPYCNRGTRAIHFGGNAPSPVTVDLNNNAGGGFGPTVAPGMGGGFTPTVAPATSGTGFGPTVAPGMGGNTNIGKTEIPDYMKARKEKEDRDRTVAVFKKKYGIEPVVGWLVCIEGPDKGKDYRLLSRINTIGRAEGNDVVLASEQTVSQKNHARLAYDEKHNNFQLIPGDGHNIMYVNDEALYVPRRLCAYDVIELGDTKLIFVPLCSESFQWHQEG